MLKLDVLHTQMLSLMHQALGESEKVLGINHPHTVRLHTLWRNASGVRKEFDALYQEHKQQQANRLGEDSEDDSDEDAKEQ